MEENICSWTAQNRATLMLSKATSADFYFSDVDSLSFHPLNLLLAQNAPPRSVFKSNFHICNTLKSGQVLFLKIQGDIGG